MSDDFLFDQQVLTTLLASGIQVGEQSISARYDNTVQSISPSSSIRYGLGCLVAIASPLRLDIS
jgi:hypothetical protein